MNAPKRLQRCQRRDKKIKNQTQNNAKSKIKRYLCSAKQYRKISQDSIK